MFRLHPVQRAGNADASHHFSRVIPHPGGHAPGPLLALLIVQGISLAPDLLQLGKQPFPGSDGMGSQGFQTIFCDILFQGGGIVVEQKDLPHAGTVQGRPFSDALHDFQHSIGPFHHIHINHLPVFLNGQTAAFPAPAGKLQQPGMGQVADIHLGRDLAADLGKFQREGIAQRHRVLVGITVKQQSVYQTQRGAGRKAAGRRQIPQSHGLPGRSQHLYQLQCLFHRLIHFGQLLFHGPAPVFHFTQ